MDCSLKRLHTLKVMSYHCIGTRLATYFSPHNIVALSVFTRLVNQAQGPALLPEPLHSLCALPPVAAPWVVFSCSNHCRPHAPIATMGVVTGIGAVLHWLAAAGCALLALLVAALAWCCLWLSLARLGLLTVLT